MRGVPRERLAISVAPGRSIVTPRISAERSTMTRRAEGGGEQSGAGGGADEGEGLHVHGVGARGGALADHDVQFVVFERGIEDLFERGLQAVYLIDEEHLAVAEIGEDRGQVALDLERWAGSLLEGGSEFVGDDVRQRRLAEAGRTVEQDVVQGFASRFGGLDGYV